MDKFLLFEGFMLEFMDLKGITTDATNRQNVYCNYHFHYQLELLLVWDGEVKVKIAGKEYLLHRGDMAFRSPLSRIPTSPRSPRARSASSSRPRSSPPFIRSSTSRKIIKTPSRSTPTSSNT